MVRTILLKYALPLQVVATVLFAVSIGLYTNLLTTSISSLPEGTNLKQAFVGLRWWNVVLLLCVLLALIQGTLVRFPTRQLRRSRDVLIGSILEGACRSIIYPTMTKHIRAIVTLREGKTGYRRTRYAYNTEGAPEMIACYPLDFGITGEAYQNRSVVVKELPVNHHQSYAEDVQKGVLPEIRSILAAPILHSNEPNDEPLGALAFDSVLPLAKIKLDSLEVRRLAQTWANVISQILVATEV